MHHHCTPNKHLSIFRLIPALFHLIGKRHMWPPFSRKGDKSKAENYRPISLTSVVAKLLKSIVNDAIQDHLTTHMILSNNQHGFHCNKSVETNLLETYNIIIKLLGAGLPVDLILLDLAKAFDKVPHRRLCIKLLSAGLNQMTVDWLMCFLTKRTQKGQTVWIRWSEDVLKTF